MKAILKWVWKHLPYRVQERLLIIAVVVLIHAAVYWYYIRRYVTGR